MSKKERKTEVENFSVIKLMSEHKNHNSICINIINIKDTENENAEGLDIFFDNEYKIVHFFGLNSKNKFANFIPVKFENVEVSYKKESNFSLFSLLLGSMFIPFACIEDEGAQLLLNYFKAIGLKCETIETEEEEESNDAILFKEIITNTDFKTKDDSTFLN